MVIVMNKVCHGEERSDVANHLEFQMDCHARRPGLAMTSGEFIRRRENAGAEGDALLFSNRHYFPSTAFTAGSF